MARVQDVTMLIYEDDKKLIEAQTLNHRNIETGGDLFGLWQSESEVVVQVVTGPGRNCRRTSTSFFQDKTYLSDVGNYLTSSKGLCNIGEWHSHHSLNLPEPSGGDRATVWRNMPGYGLKRFLLIIATIKREGNPEMNGFMFTSPEHGHRQGQMIHVRPRILSGPNPFRNQPDVEAKLSDGAESPRVEIMAAPEEGGRMTRKEKKKQKKREKKEREKTKKEEKRKRKQQRKDENERKKPKNEKSEMEDNAGSSLFKIFHGGNNYSSLADNGGTTAAVFTQDPQNGSFVDMTTVSQSSNNVADYQGGHITSNHQEMHDQSSYGGEVSSDLLLHSQASPTRKKTYT